MKNWRPNLLFVVTDNISRENIHLLNFLNQMKKGGLFIISEILLGPFNQLLGIPTAPSHTLAHFICLSPLTGRTTTATRRCEGAAIVVLERFCAQCENQSLLPRVDCLHSEGRV